MSLESIWFYCVRALWFALPVMLLCAVWQEVSRRRQKKAFSLQHFVCCVLFAGYLAALLQVTVIRDWQDFFDLSHSAAKTEIIWIPLKTTVQDAKEMGVLWELYHSLGNMAWFVPLGLLGAELFPKLRRWGVLPFAVLGFSFFVEFSQWVFQTGVSDVDDLIFNTLGGCIGFWLWRLWQKRRRKNGKRDSA